MHIQRQKWQPILGCLAVVLLVALGIGLINNLLRPVDTDSPVNAIETFHTLPENTLEVMGFGSSHMWLGMDPMTMYANYGIGAYNYGCNWQELNTTKLFLQDALRTQHPRVVIIDTFNVNTWKQDMNMDGEIYYTTAIPWMGEKLQYLRQSFGPYNKIRYLSYFMPLAAFHENWVNLSAQSFRTPAQSGDDYVKTMGFSPSQAVTPVEIPDQTLHSQESLQEEAAGMLAEIIDLCRTENIAVVLCTIPWQGTNLYADALTDFASAHECDYVNLYDHLEEMALDQAADFSDTGHLNSAGAAKVANFLGAYLKANYDLTDFRTQPDNLWSQAEKR